MLINPMDYWNYKFGQIFSDEELKKLESRSKMNEVFRNRFNIGDSTHIRVSIIESNMRPKEMMAAYSFKDDFDQYLSLNRLEDLLMFNPLGGLIGSIIFFVQVSPNGILSDYKLVCSTYIEREGFMNTMANKEILGIVKETNKHLNNSNQLISFKGRYIVCKPKDQKPYSPIFSRKYNREIADKRYGLYYTKDFLIELMNSTLANHEIKNQEFYNLIASLKISNNQAVASPDGSDTIYDDLYIERDVNVAVINKLEDMNKSNQKSLVFLVGNSGDGKSALIRRVKRDSPELLENVIIHNDATESHYPDKDCIDTLLHYLEPYSDKRIGDGNERTLIAINMGVVGRLIDCDRIDEFCTLRDYIVNSNILVDGERKCSRTNSVFDYISFSEYQLFSVDDAGFCSTYLNGVFSKLFDKTELNPFYMAYEKLEESVKVSCPVAINYALMQDAVNQRIVLDFISLTHFGQNVLYTSRIIWDFFYEILMGDELERLLKKRVKPIFSGIQFVSNLVFNRLFDRNSSNEVIKCITSYSHVFESSIFYDELLHDMYILDQNNIISRLEELNRSEFTKLVKESVEMLEYITTDSPKDELSVKRNLIVTAFSLMNREYDLGLYTDYAQLLYSYNYSEKYKKSEACREFRRRLISAVKVWNGKSNREEMINASFHDSDYKKSVKFKWKKIKYYRSEISSSISFYRLPCLVYDESFSIHIDMNLFCIINMIAKGYQLDPNQRVDYIRLNDFVRNIIDDQDKEEIQYITSKNAVFSLSYDDEDEEFRFSKEL